MVLSALALAALVLRAVAYLASWYPGDETIRASSESFLRLMFSRSGVSFGKTKSFAFTREVTIDAGDAIIFDSRTQHAGGANRSAAARPILYLVFARPWFDEAMHRRLVVGGDGGGGDGAERLFPDFSSSSSA